ncbi:MAG: JAB domain-containing protein [bacterium]
MNNPQLEEMKVVYRRERLENTTSIRMACDVVAYLRNIWNDETFDLREEVVVVCLSTSHDVKGWVRIAEGGLNSATIDCRLLFGILLSTASASFILAHNHPSGKPTPSVEDIRLTRMVHEGASLLRLRFLDHIIVTRNSHHSMCENGELPNPKD